MQTEPGVAVPLSYTTVDRATDVYPKAFVYNSAGTEITTVNLSHIANGFYVGSYTPDGTYETLKIHYVVYSDAARTVVSDVHGGSEEFLYVKYAWKPQGFGSVSTVLSKEDINKIVESLEKTIEGKINLQEILDELRKKSEFDPKKDKVKTDIKIPAISLREVNDKLDTIKKLTSEKAKQVDYSGKFTKIDKQFKEVKELIGSEIDVIRGNTEQAIKQISAIQMPEIDLQPILAGIDTILDQQVDNVRQKELLRIDIEKAMTDLFFSNRTRQEELQNKLIKELSVIQEAMPGLEAMLEALNKEDFNRINLIIEELKKINQFLKVLASMLLNKRITDEEELSGIFDLLKSNSKT